MTLDDEILQRMVKLVRQMYSRPHGWNGANEGPGSPYQSFDYEDYKEAREIVSLLPDPDLERAKSIALSIQYDGMGTSDHFQAVFTQAALAGIKHGRNSKQEG